MEVGGHVSHNGRRRQATEGGGGGLVAVLIGADNDVRVEVEAEQQRTQQDRVVVHAAATLQRRCR